MRSKFFTVFITILVLASSAIIAWAGLHVVGGAGFGSGSVLIDLTIAGISNNRAATVTATITDGTNLTAVCRNNGGNIAYGQNPVNLVGISASQTVSPNNNGSADLNLHMDVIQLAGITWEVAGCPNRNWTVTDLLGGIQVNLTASDGSFTDIQNYSCFVNELDRVIACTRQ